MDLRIDLDEAIKQHGAKLLRYAASILGNHADADDAVQDAFIAAHKNQSKFDGENLSAWLYKITYNICMNKRRQHGFLFFADMREEPAIPEYSSSQMPEIMQALSPLKPRERALLYMRIIEGYSYDELAHIMGKRPGAIRMMYMRAKEKAADLLIEFKEEI